MLSFAECAELYIWPQAPGWSNPKHIEQWRSTLKNLAGPTIGHLDKLLPRPSQVARVKHHPALPYTEVGAFMKPLREDDGVAAGALEFTILTAARTNEVIRAQRSEFDLARTIWIVPANRMKSKQQHRVPLSPAAISVLESVQGLDEIYVFPGHERHSHLSNVAMLKVLKRLGRTGITVHGFRPTFRDWCAESTNYSADVAEMALAHTLRDKTEAGYAANGCSTVEISRPRYKMLTA